MCRTIAKLQLFRLLTALASVAFLVVASPAPAAEDRMTWAVHVALAPTWFDPAETPGIITPFMVMYALHDALVKPMPGNLMTPSLAEIQQMIHERTMFAPVIEPCLLNGVGPRVEQSGLSVVAHHAYSAPYEDLALRKGK